MSILKLLSTKGMINGKHVVSINNQQKETHEHITG